MVEESVETIVGPCGGEVPAHAVIWLHEDTKPWDKTVRPPPGETLTTARSNSR